MDESIGSRRDLTDELATYAADIRIATTPAAVRKQAHLCILDTIGCIVAGGQADDWKPLMAAESESHVRPEATVLGTGERLSAEAAGRVNAYMGDIFELNDLIGGHASIGNVTALLALAESLGVTGEQLIEAVIVGLEVTARIYHGYHPAMKPYNEVGMAPVTFPSSYGVAAGAGRLMGLSADQIGHAMGIAGTLASWCPAEVVFGDGGTVKPMLFGSCAVTSGLAGAKYARAGMIGPRRLLEGSRGYFVTRAHASFPELVRDHETWYLGAPRRKYHACCGYIHSPVDVVIAMRQGGVHFEQAHEIRVSAFELAVPAVSKSRPPTSGNEARFHLEYCVALAALGENVILPKHSIEFETQIARPELRAMMAKIRVVPDPQQHHYHNCAVSILDDRGSELARREGCGPKGSPQNPMSDDEVLDKFRHLVKHRLDGTQLEEYLGKALGLECHAQWSWLVSAFG